MARPIELIDVELVQWARERVRQTKKKAIRRLHHASRSKSPRAYLD